MLHTATVLSDIYAAYNTLSRHILDPAPTAMIFLRVGAMCKDARAEFMLLRDDHTFSLDEAFMVLQGTITYSCWTMSSRRYV